MRKWEISEKESTFRWKQPCHSRSPTMTLAFLTLGERIVSFLSYCGALQLQTSICPLDLCPVNTGVQDLRLCRVVSMQESTKGPADNLTFSFYLEAAAMVNSLYYLSRQPSSRRRDPTVSLEQGSAQGFFLPNCCLGVAVGITTCYYWCYINQM